MRILHGFLMAVGLICAAGASPAQDRSAPTLSIGESEEHGPIIVGPEGRAVYTFITGGEGGDNQVPLESCNDPCLERWPLLTVEGDVTVGEGLDPDLAATLEWEDSRVAVYDSRALFLFFRDEPGAEPEGHAISSFGGFWALIAPSGDAIRTGIMPGAD